MPLAKVAGGHIHYETAGRGPVLVALHGIGGNHRSWRRQLAALADAYTVVAWDASGYGGSSDPDGARTIDDYADDVAGLLDHLGAARAHVLGISWGGVIALACYRRHPGRVTSLLLADTYRGGGTLPEPERSRRLARRLEVTESLSPAQLARERTPALFTAGADPALLSEAQSIMAEIHPAGYRQAAIALANADETALLPRIAVPTLVLCGDQDGVLPLPESETLAREIPGARLVVIPNAGHASNQEQPAAFNAAVRAFLQVRQDAPSARV
jgi:pimeloyl-ACP methyl ester carboxylesterase